jgi:hypothetical protein
MSRLSKREDARKVREEGKETLRDHGPIALRGRGCETAELPPIVQLARVDDEFLGVAFLLDA